MNRLFALLPGLLLATGVLAFIFSRIGWRDVVDLLLQVDRLGLGLFVSISLTMSGFRTWRYRILLKASGFHPRVPPLFLIVLVRNFFSDLIPARIGTLVYLPLVTRCLGVSAGAAGSSFALAFLFDVIAIVPMALLALFWVGGGAGLSTPVLALGCLFILLVALLMLAFLPQGCAWGRALLQPFLGTESSLVKWGEQKLAEIETELRRTRQAGIYARVLLLSVAVRASKYAALYLFLYALLHPQGYGLADLPVPAVFLGLLAPEIAASTPFSGIAGIGAYQGAWILVFTLLGFSQELASSTSLAHHLFTQVYGMSLGLLALLLLNLRARFCH